MANSQKSTFVIYGGKGRSWKPPQVKVITKFTPKMSVSLAQQLGIMQLIYNGHKRVNICDGLISAIDPVHLLLTADFKVGFWYILWGVITCYRPWCLLLVFSAANLALAGFPQTNALGESMPSRH